MNIVFALCILVVILQDISTILIIYHLYVAHDFYKIRSGNIAEGKSENSKGRRTIFSRSTFKKLCVFSISSQVLWVVLEVLLYTTIKLPKSEQSLVSSFLATDILSKNGIDSIVISLLGLLGLNYYLKK